MYNFFLLLQKGDSQDAAIRQTFRRLETSAIFLPADTSSTSLSELYTEDDQRGKKHSGHPHHSHQNYTPNSSGYFPNRSFASNSPYRSSGEYSPQRSAGEHSLNRSGEQYSPNRPLDATSYQPNTSRMSTLKSISYESEDTNANTFCGSQTLNSVNTKRQFVLVEESQLKELAKFETILRDERIRLGEQCVLIVPELQVRACQPIPATRLAVHCLCDAEMKKISSQIMMLNNNWREIVKKNNYNSTIDRDPSYLEHGNLVQRAQKLKEARRITKLWHVNRNRDSMSFEDDFAYLYRKYFIAKMRKLDYDRYYILAARYGPYDESKPQFRNCTYFHYYSY